MSTVKILLFVCAILVNNVVLPHETELILVSVIFRHGARTTYEFYPTDPHINETFYPTGLGGLTNEGKLGEYKLGRYLKHLYGDFLGDVYTEDSVYVQSTDVTRTKMSAELVLAGLFPPSKIQKWNNDLLWQPIPVSYKSQMEEDLFHPTVNCPYKHDVLENLPNINEVKEKFIDPYKETFTYIEENSGKSIKTPADTQGVYFILKTERDMGLPLPEWTKSVFPEPAQSISSQTYAFFNYDHRVKQINSGYLLKKILVDSLDKIEGRSDKKIFLYSGHESTLGYMLNVLNAYEPHVPPYGSALSFEIHRLHDKFYLKLRYRNHTEAREPVDLQIPGCEILCPFEQFAELQKDVIPTVSIQEACQKDGAVDANKI